MEAKTVINLTIDSYNDNDPKHGLRGVPGLASNLITNTRNSDMQLTSKQYRIIIDGLNHLGNKTWDKVETYDDLGESKNDVKFKEIAKELYEYYQEINWLRDKIEKGTAH